MNWKQQDTMTVKERKEMKEISNKTGVSKRVIRTIRCKKSWKHISKYYDIQWSNSITQIDHISEEQASTTIESISNLDEYEETIYFG